jgi:hypothetical protein
MKRPLLSRLPVNAWGRRTVMLGLCAAALLGLSTEAIADAAPRAEVMVIHATKCEKKSVDPRIGEAPPALGYDCLKLLDKKTMPLTLNQPSTAALPNGRTFQLLHTAKAGPRYKVTASVSPAGGGSGFTKLADITADPNKPFNVGGFAYEGGVLVLTVRIQP